MSDRPLNFKRGIRFQFNCFFQIFAKYSFIFQTLILSKCIVKSELDFVQGLLLKNQKLEQNLFETHQINFAIVIMNIDIDF